MTNSSCRAWWWQASNSSDSFGAFFALAWRSGWISAEEKAVVGATAGLLLNSLLSFTVQCFVYSRLMRKKQPHSLLQLSCLAADAVATPFALAWVVERSWLRLGRSNAACGSEALWYGSQLADTLITTVSLGSRVQLLLCCLDRIQALEKPVIFMSLDKARRCVHVNLVSLLVVVVVALLGLALHRPPAPTRELPRGCSRWLPTSLASCSVCCSECRLGTPPSVPLGWAAEAGMLVAVAALLKALRRRAVETEASGRAQSNYAAVKQHERTVAKAITIEAGVSAVGALLNAVAGIPHLLFPEEEKWIPQIRTVVAVATGVGINAAGTGFVLVLTSRAYQQEMLALHGFLPQRHRLAWHVAFWYALTPVLAILGALVVSAF